MDYSFALRLLEGNIWLLKLYIFLPIWALIIFTRGKLACAHCRPSAQMLCNTGEQLMTSGARFSLKEQYCQHWDTFPGSYKMSGSQNFPWDHKQPMKQQIGYNTNRNSCAYLQYSSKWNYYSPESYLSHPQISWMHSLESPVDPVTTLTNKNASSLLDVRILRFLSRCFTTITAFQSVQTGNGLSLLWVM